MISRIGVIALFFVQSCIAPRAEPASALDPAAFALESKSDSRRDSWRTADNS